MQLKIQRSQRAGGITGRTVYFSLDVRADYSQPEQDSISKYKLGKEVVYNSKAAQKYFDKAQSQTDGSVAGGLKGIASGLMARLHLVMTIDSLGAGQHIECKDLAELAEAEETIMDACKNLRGFLDLASTFDGRTILIDFDQHGEKVHHSSGMPQLGRHGPPPLPVPVALGPPTPQPVIEHAPQRPEPIREQEVARASVGSEPMRPMKEDTGYDSDHVPFLDYLGEAGNQKLLKGGVLVVGASVLLYALRYVF